MKINLSLKKIAITFLLFTIGYFILIAVNISLFSNINQTQKADVAIVFEGCPADDTFTPDYKIQSALKKGPMLRDFDVSMITHPGFQKFTLNLAKKHNIKVQRSVRKGGGTNGSAYHLADKGIPTIVVGIPVRYAHTHYGYVAYEDFESAKELVLTILKELDQTIFDQL